MRRALWTLLALLASAALGAAQEPAGAAPPAGSLAPPRAVSSRDQAVLRARDRKTMHPGDPFELVGLEQGDNDLRRSTPALLNSDRVARHVDQADAYARQLAMVEVGAIYHAPPRTDAPWRAARPDAARAPVAPAPAPPAAAQERRASWIWAVALGLAVSATLWWLEKRLRLAVWRAR